MRHHSLRSGLFRRWLTTTTALASALPLLALTIPAAYANPEGGTVVQGAATITQTNPNTVTINQSTDKAIINWPSFDIGADETTRFNQPSPSSATLNRVTGDQVSKILGNLSANGKVFLVNPNGIVFGAGSKIDVAALVASTADIKNENFMAGNLRFDIPGKLGAEIINQGTITAADGGLVALVSPVLRNSGVIQARLGKVALASANGVTLDLYGDNLILFQAADQITQQMVSTDGKPVNTAIDNRGQIYADGGRVLMTANTAKGVVDNAINTTGLVSARAVEQQGGEIVLKGEDGGIVQVAGRLDASGTGTGQTGGRITVQGDGVTLADGASLDASGDAGGGKATVGSWNSSTARMVSGATIDVTAKTTGNGGVATVIAADTDVAGSIHAKGGENGGNGGMIETSGHALRVANLHIDASARRGLAGQWLLDPYDLTVDANAASSISGSLNTGTNVSLLTTANGASGPGNASSGNGDIIIASALGWTGSGALSLSAYRNIQINAAVTHGGNGLLNMTPDNSGTGTGNVLTGSNGSVKFTGAGGLRIGGNDYTLIRNIEQLQAIELTGDFALSGYYALAGDIDASATAGWNGGDGWSNGVGFRPIGYYFIDSENRSRHSGFMGTMDGLGNKISNLTINKQDGESLGLFTAIENTGLVQNLEIQNGSLRGNSFLGLITGKNWGNIVNVRVGGKVDGDWYLGGMVGNNIGTVSYGASTADVTGQKGVVGGLVGLNYSSSIIRNSNAASTVKGADRVGGLVGLNWSAIQRSTASGTTTGRGDVGGLVGMNDWNGEISESSASGTVGGTTSNNPDIHEIQVGGLVGSNIRGGRISTSYATANVYGNAIGNNRLGGLVGWNGGTIATSYATGVVYGEGTGRHEVGGLVGWNGGTVSKSYATGRVAGSGGENALGGLVGSVGYHAGADELGTVADSFWNTGTTRQNSSAGGTGLTTAQMNDPATFTNAGWDTSVWNLTAGHTPTLKSVGAAGNSGSGGGGNNTNPGNGGGSDIDPPPEPNDNPLMGLDAAGLYATILSNNWADSYSTNSYWLEVAEASGAYLSDDQKEADIMLKAWARYRNYSGQALADKLYLDYLDQNFKINDTRISNSPDNPIWYGAYGSAGKASDGQKTANIMIQAYRKFGNATARELFGALVAGRVTLDGISAQQEIDNSPDNVVWRGIYGADRRASEAQKTANAMMVAREKYAANLVALTNALKNGAIIQGSPEWLALMDGWETDNPRQSTIQKQALEWINKFNERKDEKNIEEIPVRNIYKNTLNNDQLAEEVAMSIVEISKYFNDRLSTQMVKSILQGMSLLPDQIGAAERTVQEWDNVLDDLKFRLQVAKAIGVESYIEEIRAQIRSAGGSKGAAVVSLNKILAENPNAMQSLTKLVGKVADYAGTASDLIESADLVAKIIKGEVSAADVEGYAAGPGLGALATLAETRAPIAARVLTGVGLGLGAAKIGVAIGESLNGGQTTTEIIREYAERAQESTKVYDDYASYILEASRNGASWESLQDGIVNVLSTIPETVGRLGEDIDSMTSYKASIVYTATGNVTEAHIAANIILDTMDALQTYTLDDFKAYFEAGHASYVGKQQLKIIGLTSS